MKLHRLLPVLVLLAAAACGSRPAPTASPTAQPATDTGQPPTAAAALTVAPSPQPSDTQAPDTPTATLAPATVAPTLAPATDTAAPVAATDTATAAASTATLAPSPTEAPPTESPTSPATLSQSTIIGQHVVQPGETLFCIARGYGVLPAAIAQTNGLNQALFIFPGQVLQIPAVPWDNIVPGPVCPAQFNSPFAGLPALTSTPVASPTLPQLQPTVTPATFTPLPPATIIGQHVVLAGETVFCIGRGYGVLPAAIAQTNGLGQQLLIYPGQVLKIPAVQWVNIAPGPVCLPQFTSPFPGLPLLTATPAISPTPPAPLLSAVLNYQCIANCNSKDGTYVVHIVVQVTGGDQPYSYDPGYAYDVTVPHCTTGLGTAAVTSADGQTAQAAWSYHDVVCP